MPDPMEKLAAAIASNDVGMARGVLQSHPEIKSKLDDPMPGGHFGQTPLLAAVQRKNLGLIDALLQAGAGINVKSHWWAGGFGVLDNDSGLAPLLIQRGAALDAYAASRLGMVERLKELISADRQFVNMRGGDGQTPLHVAANVEIAEFLLDHGAQIDAVDVDHESTPAQYLIRDRQDVVRLLISRGCRTDLLMACALGDVDLVRKHLDADPNSIRMSVGAADFPMRDPRAGGTIYIWTLGGDKTPHQVAREFGHENVFALLMERSPMEVKLSQACELGDEATFKALLAAKPDLVRRLSKQDGQRLVSAARANNGAAVGLMLGAGWPADAAGPGGDTALHWAAFHGNAAMATEILRHHPPLELKDRIHHSTPLGWGIYGSENGWHRQTGQYVDTIKALLDAGAAPPRDNIKALQTSQALRDLLRRTSPAT
jgi:ankyrin repeat protein